MKMNNLNLSPDFGPATTVALVMSERNKWICAGYRGVLQILMSEKVSALNLVTSGMGSCAKRRFLKIKNEPKEQTKKNSDQHEASLRVVNVVTQSSRWRWEVTVPPESSWQMCK